MKEERAKMLELTEAYEEQTGRKMKADAHMALQVTNTFAVSAEQIAKLNKGDSAAFAAKKSRMEDVFSLRFEEIKSLWDLEKIDKETLDSRMAAAQSAMDTQRAQQDLQFKYMTEGFEGVLKINKSHLGGMTAEVAVNTAMMGVHYSRFTESTKGLLGELPEEVRTKAQETMDILNDGYRKEVALLDKKALGVDVYREKLMAADKKFSESAQLVAKEAERAVLAVAEGATLESATAGLEKQAEVFSDKIGDAVSLTLSETEAAAAAAFGVTGKEAMDFLKDMAGVDPKTLKKSLEKIKKQYISFLKAVQTEGKKLLKDTKVQFGEYQKTFEEFWKDMESFANDYGQKILTISRNFWTAILGLSRNGTTQMTAAATLMISTLETNFKKVNILDILTAGGKIRSWAINIVKGLQAAFAGTNPFDTAIEIAARNATAIIKSMEGERGEKGTVTPVNRMSHRQVSTQSARSKVRDDLIAATNEPTWSLEAKEQRDRANAILENGFRTLLMLNAGGSAQKKTERALNRGTINLREAPDT
jgi:hypothetical protein